MLYAETGNRLISSARVEGTAVFDRRADRVGTVHSVMLDKESGQAEYAVLLFGGLWRFGQRAYPVPWNMLRYDRDVGGYMLDLTREQVEAAPYITLDRADRPQEVPEPAYRHWDQYM